MSNIVDSVLPFFRGRRTTPTGHPSSTHSYLPYVPSSPRVHVSDPESVGFPGCVSRSRVSGGPTTYCSRPRPVRLTAVTVVGRSVDPFSFTCNVLGLETGLGLPQRSSRRVLGRAFLVLRTVDSEATATLGVVSTHSCLSSSTTVHVSDEDGGPDPCQ